MRWKKILGILGAFVIFLIIAVYIVLSTYDFNNLKPKISQTAKSATGRQLTLGGNIDLNIGLEPALVVNDVGLQNAAWGSRPQMATIKRFEIQVALIPLIFGNIEVKRLVFVEPDILIETNKAGKSNLEFETTKKPKPVKPREEEKAEIPEDLAVNRVRIEGGLLTFRNGETGKTKSIKINVLNASGIGTRDVNMDLRGAYQDMDFEVSGTFGSLEIAMDKENPWPLDLKAQAAGATVNVKGTVKDLKSVRGVDLNFSAEGKDLAELNELTGKRPLLNGPYRLSGHLDDSAPKTYKVTDFKLSLGNSDLKGAITLAMGGKRPKVIAGLISEKLDLRSLLPKESELDPANKDEIQKKRTKRDKIFSDDPLPIETLRQVDAEITFNTPQILLPHLALDKFTTNVSLENGNLLVKPLRSTMGDGTLEGRFSLHFRGRRPNLAAVLVIDDLDVGHMLGELGVSKALEGGIDLDVDIKGSGRSVAEIMAVLDGKVSIVMNNGLISHKYLRYAEILATDQSSGIFRLLDAFQKEDEDIKINCFVTRFDISSGIADATALVFDTKSFGVVGRGNVNLKNERLNLSIDPISKQSTGTLGIGDVQLNLSELTKPLKLGGTLANPSIAVDPKQTLVTAGKALGGEELFGPQGIAAALLGSSAEGSDVKNPCVAAIEAAREGKKASGKRKPQEQKASPDEQVAEEVGKTLRQFFGN